MKLLTKTLILSLSIFLCISAESQNKPSIQGVCNGIPAKPAFTHFTQSDGEILKIKPHGDAIINWAETIDGYTIIHNKDGDLTYAIKDHEGFLTPSEVIAHSPEKRNSNETSFIRNLSKGYSFPKEQVTILKAAHQFTQRKKATRNPGSFPTTGTPKLLVILANFSDSSPSYTQTQLDQPMNQIGYNGKGCLSEYFQEVSYGQLNLQISVINWIQLPQAHHYYAPEAKWGEFAFDAISAADANIDFSQFDNDGDGIVEAISIIHQGAGQEASYDTNDIWSHMWTLEEAGYNLSQRTFDGVELNTYTCQPEDDGTGNINTIGIMCHEIGHLLGAPDFYDTDYALPDFRGTGFWDLQADGLWNGTPMGSSPAHPNLFTKIYYYEWLNAIELNSTLTINMLPTNTYQQAYFYTTTNSNEYFLIENQQKSGFDSDIPGHGLLIYHVDQDYIDNHFSSNDINATLHQGLMLINAGNNGNIDSPACTFPGDSLNLSFTDITTPSSINWTGGQTNKPITNISSYYNQISFDFMGGSGCIPPPMQCSNLESTNITDNSIEIKWTRGLGEKVLVLVKEGSPIETNPMGTTVYNDNPQFGFGDGPELGIHAVYYDSDTICQTINLNPGTEYHFALFEAFSGNNCYTLPGLHGNFQTTGTSKLDNKANISNIQIKLSNDNNTLYIENLQASEIISYNIINLNSETIFTGKNTNKINISTLPNGIYMLIILDSDHRRTTHRFFRHKIR